MNGFTVIELLIVIAVVVILAAASAPLYGNLQVSSQLNESASMIVQTIRTALQRSEARYNGAAHGVYFDINAGGNDAYILYQGASYATRDGAYDRPTTLDNSISLSASGFTMTGSDVDINFSKGLGIPDNTGTITLTHDVNGSRSVSVNSWGKVEEE